RGHPPPHATLFPYTTLFRSREAYREGLDIHARTAAALYGVPEDAVTADMRRAAKVVNFGVLYGMGAHRLAGQLKIPYAEAKKFIDRKSTRLNSSHVKISYAV